MKVTIVQGAFLPIPPVRGGAVEKLWFALGIALAEGGISVTHISRLIPGQSATELDSGVQRIRIPGFDWSNYKLISRMSDLIYSWRVSRILPDADIVVTNTLFLPFLIRNKRKGMVYVSVHRYPRKQFGWYLKASRFQCVSHAVARALTTQCPRCADRVRVIPNFVSNVAKTDIINWYSQREKILLFVGRIHPEKGLQVLLDAFAKLPSNYRGRWRLQIVGPYAESAGGGGEKYYKTLLQKMSAGNISVDWIGSVYRQEELQDYYRKAKIFVYPSLAVHGEAFPLAPLEAMAQGTPILVSCLDVFQEYLEPGVNGWDCELLGEDAADQLQRALILAMDAVDGIHGEQYSAEALKTAQNFTLKQIAQEFSKDFLELLSNE